MIGMDYYDPDLLAYDNEFPLQEAFRVDWGVDAGGGPRRFALYIIPPRVFPASGAPMMRAWLCRTDQRPCQPVPGAVTTYFGSDQPRITVEVSLPWRALGRDASRHPRDNYVSSLLPRPGTAPVGCHGADCPPIQAMQDPSQWRLVRLAGD